MSDYLTCSTQAVADLAAILHNIPECAAYADEIAAAACDVRPQDSTRFGLLIAAVGQIETQWGRVRGHAASTGPSIIGDDGHGRGLMQIDDRYHHIDGWDDPATNIAAGARILDAGLSTFAGNLAAGVACYNCGPGNVMHSLSEDPRDPDRFTTGKDYSRRVLSYYSRWLRLVVP